MENIFHSNTNQKNVGMMILISDKEDYRTKNITPDKEDNSSRVHNKPKCLHT